jgi:tartrate dehydratase alpha subunit/fumarate hydratase class I-like protein
MSTQQPQVSAEQIRQVRHYAFQAATARLPEDRRARLAQAYQAQDSRRERNVSSFVKEVTGQ